MQKPVFLKSKDAALNYMRDDKKLWGSKFCAYTFEHDGKFLKQEFFSRNGQSTNLSTPSMTNKAV